MLTAEQMRFAITSLKERLDGEVERAVLKGDLREAQDALAGKAALTRLENTLQFVERAEAVVTFKSARPKRA